MVRARRQRKPPSRRARILGSVGAIAVATLVVGKGHEPPTADASIAQACFAKLTGAACDDVWHRTLSVLQKYGPGARDAVHTAFVYVCIDRKYEPPALCGAFRNKAERLRIDAWRYTRRFRDEPAAYDLACPVPSAEYEALKSEEVDQLDNARSQLDGRSREILDLAYGADLTDAKIAARIGLSTVRVRVLRRAAEQRLQAILARCQ
jgi:RNA polymerase sigma factor (sigma-70 family)